jgi:hypothetical protein
LKPSLFTKILGAKAENIIPQYNNTNKLTINSKGFKEAFSHIITLIFDRSESL